MTIEEVIMRGIAVGALMLGIIAWEREKSLRRWVQRLNDELGSQKARIERLESGRPNP